MNQENFDQINVWVLGWMFIWCMTQFFAPVFQQYMYEAILPKAKECEDPGPYIYKYSEPALEVYDEEQ